MLVISEFSSLNFRTDWKGRTNTDVDYHQRFLPTDEIKVQFTSDAESFSNISAVLYSHSSKEETEITPISVGVNTAQIKLPGLSMGRYDLTIQAGDDMQTTSFCIVDSWGDSILLKYTNYRTEFGAVFLEPFYFRVEGIFLPVEVNFEVSTEDFRDQRYNATMLSAFPYEKYTLTVGLGQGVPNWVGRKLNYIFSCSEVYIDGERFVRSEGSAPQKTVLQQDNPLFVWKIDVEPQEEETVGDIPATETTRAIWGNYVRLLKYVTDIGFTAAPNPINFTKDGGNQTLTITTGFTINSVTSPAWLTIVSQGAGTYLVTTGKHIGSSARTGAITFDTSGGTFTVNVTQQYEQLYFTVSPASFSVEASGGTRQLAISTNHAGIPQAPYSDNDWITIERISDLLYSIIMTANPTGIERIGYVRVDNPLNGMTMNIQATQKAQASTMQSTAAWGNFVRILKYVPEIETSSAAWGDFVRVLKWVED